MALDDNGRKELYRKLLNDPATSAGTKKYSFTQWEQKIAESPNALAKIGAYAISKKWANDLEDFSNRYGAGAKPYTPPSAPKPKAAPVVAPVAVEEEAFVEPPVGIAAPVPQKPQTFTDIAREEIAKVPKTRPVSKPIEPISMEPQGFFEGLGTQFQRGIAQGKAIQSVNMGQLRDAAQGKNLDAIPYEQIAEANRAVKQFGQTQTEVDLAKKEGLIKDAWDVVKALPGVTIESLASLGRSGLEEVLVGAGMGAAGGSVVPVIGTAVGGGLGATSGMVQAGRNMEYFGTLMQELEANGVDITDAKQLREGIAKYGKNADKTAITRANTIAAVETALPIVGKVAGTAAGRVGSKVVQKPLQAASKALTYEPVAGPLGGATGELAAQIASGQEIDPQAIALEAGGEGAATVAAVARAIKGEKKVADKVLGKIKQQGKIAQAMEEAVKANPEAEGQIRQQYQKRINEAAPKDEEVLSAYESLSVLPETEEKNAIRENLEVYMAEKGIAPEAEVETVSAEELQGPGFQIAYAKTREEIPQEYRGMIAEVERPTTRLGRFGPMEKVFAYRVPTETIDITAPEAVTEEDIAEEIPFEEVPAEEVVVPPQEEDEDLAAFGRELEAIEQAAPVAPVQLLRPELPEIQVPKPEGFAPALRKLGYTDEEISKMTIEQQQDIVINKTEPARAAGESKVDVAKENQRVERVAEAQRKIDEEIAAEEAALVAPEVVAAAPVEEVAPEVVPAEPVTETPQAGSVGVGGDVNVDLASVIKTRLREEGVSQDERNKLTGTRENPIVTSATKSDYDVLLKSYKNNKQKQLLDFEEGGKEEGKFIPEKGIFISSDTSFWDNKIKAVEQALKATPQAVVAAAPAPKGRTEVVFPKAFEATEVKPYAEVEDNYYRPDQQLKFNQGTYEPVRIIAHPDVIRAMSIGSKLRDPNKRKTVTEQEINFADGIAKQLGFTTESGKGNAIMLHNAARELAKQNRSNTEERFVVIGEEQGGKKKAAPVTPAPAAPKKEGKKAEAKEEKVTPTSKPQEAAVEIAKAFTDRFGIKVNLIDSKGLQDLLSKSENAKEFFFKVLDKIDVFETDNIQEAKNFITTVFQTVESAEDAKRAYRKLAVKYHPDKRGSEEVMKHLNDVNEKYQKGTLGRGAAQQERPSQATKEQRYREWAERMSRQYEADARAYAESSQMGDEQRARESAKAQAEKEAREARAKAAQPTQKETKAEQPKPKPAQPTSKIKKGIIESLVEFFTKPFGAEKTTKGEVLTFESRSKYKQDAWNKRNSLKEENRKNELNRISENLKNYTSDRITTKQYRDNEAAIRSEYANKNKAVDDWYNNTVVAIDKAYEKKIPFAYKQYVGDKVAGLYDPVSLQAYVVLDNLDETTFVHEAFSHPFIEAVKERNNELYNNLLAESKNTQEIVDYVDENYGNAPQQVKDAEYIARAIDLDAKGKLKNKTLIEYVRQFWAEANKIFKDIFGGKGAAIENISPTTKVSDIVDFVLTSGERLDLTKPSAPSFTSQQSSEAATAFDKAKTSKGFDKKHGKGAYKALSDITKNFEDIMDKVSEKIKQDCIV